jgi:hypothetical protein
MGQEDAVDSEDDRATDEPAAAETAADPAERESAGGFPDRRLIDLSRDPTPGVPDHAAPDDAE